MQLYITASASVGFSCINEIMLSLCRRYLRTTAQFRYHTYLQTPTTTTTTTTTAAAAADAAIRLSPGSSSPTLVQSKINITQNNKITTKQ